MAFIPSSHSYGASSGESALDKAMALLQSAAPALSLAQELAGKSSLEKLSILQAKIKNYQAIRTTPPYSVVPGTAWYDAEIRKMRAQIRALEVEAAQESATTEDYASWRKLTTVGGIAGISLAAAAIYYVVQKGRQVA